MFENLTDRLTQTLRNLRGVGKLTESNMTEALGEVRTALLAADVNFQVARDFIEDVKQQCLGQEVLQSVTPAQQVVKILNDALVKLLGEGVATLSDKRPLRIMLVGLHGSGKTTSSAKLARVLTVKGRRPALIACDVYRPAAIDQLEQLAGQENLLFYGERDQKDVVSIARKGLSWSQQAGADAVIFDTAGRLQIDETLIAELKQLQAKVNPHEVLLVADSALGREAVDVAQRFHEAVSLTGIILTKLDGDARGGAALSMKAVTGVPIKYTGTGEKMADFDVFYPDRMASRILGMGDVVSLVEKAQDTIDAKEAERMEKKLRRAEFNFEDFLQQLQQMRKMGPLESLVGMLPGASGLQVGDAEKRKLKSTEAIVQSMTPQERCHPNILNGSRRIRIAKGSGTEVRDVNNVLKQFQQMRKMMKGGKMKKMMKALQSMG